MIPPNDRLTLGLLVRTFWGRITVTWTLTLFETAIFALLPLLIGRSIDGLLAGDWQAFQIFIGALGVLLLVATLRRVYDTRAYGTMRVEIGKWIAARGSDAPVSKTNARVLMGRELVDFMELEAPQSVTAIIQILVSVLILLSFHNALALSASGAAIVIVLIYGLFARVFFKLNRNLNGQAEQQVSILEAKDLGRTATHLLTLRRHEVRLSDLESVVYGVIFLVLLSMLAFNLWFAATQSGASAGEIFSIVT